MCRSLRTSGAPTALPKRSLCAAALLARSALKQERASCAKLRSPWLVRAAPGALEQLAGALSGRFLEQFSSDFAIERALRRKRVDMRFDCAMASETHVGRPTRHVEIATNRPKLHTKTGARPDVEQKRPPNALRRGFGTSRGVRECPGAPGERPETLRGRPGSSPGESRSVSGASPEAPESPKIARQRPRSTFI